MAEDFKSRFPGYFRPSDDEFAALWLNATLVLDASSILDLYRIGARGQRDLLTAMAFFKGRVYVPHQFALEFMRNRAVVVAESARSYEEALKHLEDILKRAEEGRAPPTVSDSALAHLRSSRDELKAAFREQHALLHHDPVMEKLTDFVGAAIGEQPTSSDVVSWSRVAEERYAREEPPGYRDITKPTPDRYGDYFGWMQSLAWATTNKKSVIFITSDVKDDWWRSTRGYVIGPHPKLVEEFKRVCSTDFWAYRTCRFVEECAKYVRLESAAETSRELDRLKSFEIDGVGPKKKTPADAAEKGTGKKKTERDIDASKARSSVPTADDPGEEGGEG